MNLTKEIIEDIVSYIDFKDIRNFVYNYPELVQAEEPKKILITSIVITGVIIKKVSNLEYINFTMKGGEKYGTDI